MPSLWRERQNPLGGLPGVWALLPGGGLDASPQTPTSFLVADTRSGSRSRRPVCPDHGSFPALIPLPVCSTGPPPDSAPTRVPRSGPCGAVICSNGATWPRRHASRKAVAPGRCPGGHPRLRACGGGRRHQYWGTFYASRSGCAHGAQTLGDTHDRSGPYVPGCRRGAALRRLARLAGAGAGPQDGSDPVGVPVHNRWPARPP